MTDLETHPDTAPNTASLPTLVIGAGPIGLAAAAHLLGRGLDPLVVERGPQAGAAVRSWGHVRLFSRWAELIDPAAARLLTPTAWTASIRPPSLGCLARIR